MAERFSIENSRFFPRAPHWHLVRRHTDPKPMRCVVLSRHGALGSKREACGSYGRSATLTVSVDSDPKSLFLFASEGARRDELLCFVSSDLAVDNEDWAWEALGLFELFPDTVMVGGRIRNEAGEILEAGLQFGFGGLCGSPDRGRKETDPGYFGQAWKQRSVSAVSLQCAVVDPAFLVEAVTELPAGTSFPLLGAWLGAHALRTAKRVIYTPFLGGVSSGTCERVITTEEAELFASRNPDILPDRRYYPKPLSLEKGYAIVPVEHTPK